MSIVDNKLVIDEPYILQTLKELVAINSVNPSLSPDGRGEAELGGYVADQLQSLGLEVTTYPQAPGRVNVVGKLPGSSGGRSLLLNAHMDTVAIDNMRIAPLGAEVKDGRLYGRGAQDMKGSLAAMIGAAKALAESGIELAGDLYITAVADEEYRSIGTEDLLRHLHTDAAIVTEPTDLTLCRAHRGFIWYDIETFGRAAHGSRYLEGIDANMRMGRVLARLEILERALRQRPGHPLVGPPSLHAALLQGGSEISVYAAHCLLQLERRTIPGETEQAATRELQQIIDQLAMEDETFAAAVEPVFQREPFEISEDARIVQTLATAMRRRLGGPPEHTGQTFWTDAALFSEAGIDTVLVGPIGYGLHSAEEWVDIQSVMDLTDILAQTAASFCQ